MQGNIRRVSEAEGPWEEIAATKKWLRELRVASGMTQAELGARMGLTARAVLNAESPKEGLPRGLPFLKMLRALGVVVDAPLAVDSLEDRLQALETKIDRQGAATTKSLASLAEAVRALETRRAPQGGRARKARAG